jgi:hypothetical protein
MGSVVAAMAYPGYLVWELKNLGAPETFFAFDAS